VSPDFVRLRMEEMENWLAAKGRRYKNYLAALRNWVIKAKNEGLGAREKGQIPGRFL